MTCSAVSLYTKAIAVLTDLFLTQGKTIQNLAKDITATVNNLVNPPPARGTYQWWLYINQKAPATMTSISMGFLEIEL